MIKLTVLNESTVTTDAEVQHMLPAFAQQWNKDLMAAWGVAPVTMTFHAKASADKIDPAAWWLVFLDDADQAGALAYHDLTDKGLPISKVFCRTILSDNALVSVGATHELVEMAVDPWLNSAYQDATGKFWAGEIADPVEDDAYGYDIGGVRVTDFATPAWFGHQSTPAGAKMDLQGHAHAAFSILAGGYAQYFDPTQGWQQIVGQAAARHASAVHPQPGSRRERRARRHHGLIRSAPRSP